MPIEGKLGSLYVDKEQTQPLFPRTKTKAITDDNNIRLDITLDSLKTTVNSKASEAFVMNAIANAQLGGGGEGDIDLSGLATKDDIATLDNAIKAIDFPVDSVNGKTGDVQLSAEDVGAVNKSGSTMTGWLNFNGTVGPEWTTSDGTRFAVRPYAPGNLFQITIKPSGGTEVSALNISNQGDITLAKALPIAQGGTGATDAATARSNLEIIPEIINAARYQRVWGDLTTKGWYRIATVAKSSAYRITLGTYYQNTPDLTTVFDVITVHGSAGFGNYHTNASTTDRSISQIRLVQKSSTEFYVEFYYNIASKNPVFASVISMGYETGCTMHGFTSVSSTASGFVTSTLSL